MTTFPVVDGVEVFRLPPDGYVVDFENPKSQKVLNHHLVFAIMGPVAFLALVQRFYVKIFLIARGLHVDDYFMLIGWLCSVLTQVLMTTTIAQQGLCHHSWEMSLAHFERYSLIAYITAPVYQLCNGFVKLSLLTVYLQIFPQVWLRIAIWASIVLVTAYTVVISFMMWFNCNPPAKQFDFSIQGGTCIDAGILYMATAVSNIITDAILFILPMPILYKLHMGLSRKIAAAAILGIGSATIATSVVRLVYLPSVLRSTDPSWDAAPANVWTFIEGNLFVICGSMPTINKFFNHFIPKFTLFTLVPQSSHPSSGRSYGSKSATDEKRSEYSRFNNSTTDNESVDRIEIGLLRPEVGLRCKSTIGATRTGERDVENAFSGMGATRDEIERSIVQTRSFAVQYNRKESVGS